MKHLLPLSRRKVLLAGAVAAGGLFACARAGKSELSTGSLALTATDASNPEPPRTPKEAFDRWLFERMTVRDGPASGFVYYYDRRDTGPTILSTPVTAKTILYLLQTERKDRAIVSGEALLRVQRPQTGAPRLRGAIPTEHRVTRGRLGSGSAYYSGDNLLAASALYALYQATDDVRFLRGASAACTFVVGTMMNGVSCGAWADDLAAPMQCIHGDGAMVNTIFTSVEFLWLPVLRDVGMTIRSDKMIRAFERANAFLSRSALPSGAIYDRYEPGFPPRKYSQSQWKPYSPGVLVGDNLLRGAMAFARAGNDEAATRTLRFVKHRDGAVPAYLSLETGDAKFLPVDPIYYDVVCTGMIRSLAKRAGDSELVAKCEKRVASQQDHCGGWYWGVRADDGKPVEPRLATLTGLWAVHDFLAHV